MNVCLLPQDNVLNNRKLTPIMFDRNMNYDGE